MLLRLREKEKSLTSILFQKRKSNHDFFLRYIITLKNGKPVVQTSPSGAIQLKNRIIHTVTPHGKDVVHSLLPKGDNHFIGAAASSAGSSSIVTSTPIQPQKPITIMAKDPKTGIIRPVTLLPKQAVKQPMAIRLASPIGQVSHQCFLRYVSYALGHFHFLHTNMGPRSPDILLF